MHKMARTQAKTWSIEDRIKHVNKSVGEGTYPGLKPAAAAFDNTPLTSSQREHLQSRKSIPYGSTGKGVQQARDMTNGRRLTEYRIE